MPPRSPYLAPLIALSALLVVLVVAIGVVGVVKFAGGDGTPSGSRSPSPTPGSSDGDIDECVVRTWRVTSHEEKVSIESVGAVTFTGSGAIVTLEENGSGEINYGDGTRYSGTANGRTITLTLSGQVHFQYAASDGTVSFRDVSADGNAIVAVDGTEIGRTDLEGSDDPATYECSATKLVETTQLYRVEMEPAG